MIRDYNDVHANTPQCDVPLMVVRGTLASVIPTVQTVLSRAEPGSPATTEGAVRHEGLAERLKQESHQQLIWRRCLAQNLPQEWLRDIRVWQDEHHRLVLTCPNGAIAAKLRQLAPRCLHCFRATSAEVSGIRVEVQGDAPNHGRSSARSPKACLPSAAARDLIQLAERVRDPGLAQALRRLADRAR